MDDDVNDVIEAERLKRVPHFELRIDPQNRLFLVCLTGNDYVIGATVSIPVVQADATIRMVNYTICGGGGMVQVGTLTGGSTRAGLVRWLPNLALTEAPLVPRDRHAREITLG